MPKRVLTVDDRPVSTATPPDLFDYQLAELQHCRVVRNALLLSDPGVGKTPVLLTRSGEVLAAGGTVWWLTTASLVAQLHSEAALWLPAGVPLPVDFDKAQPFDRFVVATYEKVRARRQQLNHVQPDLLVLDEVDEVGGGGISANHGIFNAVSEMSARSKSVIGATGTP